MVKKKKLRLTKDEEFQMMKMILDKFALLGVILLSLGIALLAIGTDITIGFGVLGIGVVVMLIFAWILAKEIHMLEHK
ncbi:MAG: hypothetical protein ACLFTH_02985 [Candidatus Woesearchaeota archaeon]